MKITSVFTSERDCVNITLSYIIDFKQTHIVSVKNIGTWCQMSIPFNRNRDALLKKSYLCTSRTWIPKGKGSYKRGQSSLHGFWYSLIWSSFYFQLLPWSKTINQIILWIKSSIMWIKSSMNHWQFFCFAVSSCLYFVLTFFTFIQESCALSIKVCI